MTEIRSLVVPRHSCQPRATLHSSWYVEPATHLSATQGVGDGKQEAATETHPRRSGSLLDRCAGDCAEAKTGAVLAHRVQGTGVA